MKAALWLAVDGDLETSSQTVQLVPGVGLTVTFRDASLQPEDTVQVVIEPEAGPELVGLVDTPALRAAFAKWAGVDAGGQGPWAQRVGRGLLWDVWQACYLWTCIQRHEGYAAAMAALDRKADLAEEP